MADDTIELKKRISQLERICATFNKQIVFQSKQISSLIARNRNLEMKVETLTNLINNR